MAAAGAHGPRRARCPRRSGLSRAQFEAEYLIPNRPCILTDQTVGWGARTAWTRADGSVDAGALLTSETMRRARVPVDESPQGSGYGEAVRTHMRLDEFVARWRGAADGGGAYLKDWHFAQEYPAEAADAYAPPRALPPDWLNGWWRGPRSAWRADPTVDDFRFLYLGGRDTWTALHHDVLCSYSWSANVGGTKRWILFPPSVTTALLDGPTGEPPADARACAAVESRGWRRVGEARLRGVEVVQRAGEVIFVPSGWYHQARHKSSACNDGGSRRHHRKHHHRHRHHTRCTTSSRRCRSTTTGSLAPPPSASRASCCPSSRPRGTLYAICAPPSIIPEKIAENVAEMTRSTRRRGSGSAWRSWAPTAASRSLRREPL